MSILYLQMACNYCDEASRSSRTQHYISPAKSSILLIPVKPLCVCLFVCSLSPQKLMGFTLYQAEICNIITILAFNTKISMFDTKWYGRRPVIHSGNPEVQCGFLISIKNMWTMPMVRCGCKESYVWGRAGGVI